MTVIPFPSPPPDRTLTSAEKTRMLIALVTGLRTMGEPATLDELALFAKQRLSRARLPQLKRDIETVLREHADPRAAQLFGCAPFRIVSFGGQEAWAFSKAFRAELANSGLEIRLRPAAG